MGKENEIIENMYGEMSTKIGGGVTVHSALIKKLIGIKDYSLEGSNFKRVHGGTLKTLGRLLCEYILSDKEGKREAKFLLKYWEPVEGLVPSLLRRDDKGRLREYRDYCFLGEVSSVPKAYLIEEILREKSMTNEQIRECIRQLKILPKSIIIDYVGDTTLDDKVRETKTDDRSAREDIIRNVLEYIVDFQIEATQKSRSWATPQNGLGGLFDERTMDERVLDYTRALLKFDRIEELPEDLREKLIKSYSPITRSYEKTTLTPMVCHGDLNTTNIIIGENGKYYFIDPKLKLRDPLVDLACLLSSPGILLENKEWEEIAKEFRIKIFERGGVRARGPFASLTWDKETGKAVFNFLYNQILHNSFRNLAIITNIESLEIYRKNIAEDEEGMRCNIRGALERLVNEPEKLGVAPEDAKLYENFESFLKEAGILQKEKDDNIDARNARRMAYREILKAQQAKKIAERETEERREGETNPNFKNFIPMPTH